MSGPLPPPPITKATAKSLPSPRKHEEDVPKPWGCWREGATADAVPNYSAGLLPGQGARRVNLLLKRAGRRLSGFHRPPRCCRLSPWEIREQITVNPLPGGSCSPLPRLEVIPAVIREQQRVSIELRRASTVLSKLRSLTAVGLGPSVTHAGNTSFQSAGQAGRWPPRWVHEGT